MTGIDGPGRRGCAECGVGLRSEPLPTPDGRALCPRCFALATPAGAASSAPAPHALWRDPQEISVDDLLEGTDGAETRPHSATGRRPRGSGIRSEIRAWAAGRTWWIRAPLLLWLAWILFRYWDATGYGTIFQGIDLAIHEIGHILWAPLGEFMGFAGGTLTQLLAPVAAGAVLYRQRDWFGVSFAIAWVGINCFEIATYAGDALTRQLPLVSPTTGTPEHDWTYMLARLGILHHTDAVAAAWQWAGRLSMAWGVGFGAWLLWLMATVRPEAAGAGEGGGAGP